MPAQAPMIRPSCSEQLDYEAELMLIIGKGGRHIAEADALQHVFGYTIFNDGSVREYQRKTHQWGAGKNFDNTGAVGPIVVTPDELPEGATGLAISTRSHHRHRIRIRNARDRRHDRYGHASWGGACAHTAAMVAPG